MKLNLDNLKYEDISLTLNEKEYTFSCPTVATQRRIEEIEEQRKKTGSISLAIEQLVIVTGIPATEFESLPVPAISEISQAIAHAMYIAKKKD